MSNKQKHYFVSVNGRIYKFSGPQMKKQLENLKNGQDFDMGQGKKVAEDVVRIDDLNDLSSYGEQYLNDAIDTVSKREFLTL
jgi:hypothetical protein